MRTPLIAGNWKMFKTTQEAVHFADEFKKIYVKNDIRVAICAPERRQYFLETDETVNKKLRKAFSVGITPIMCVGEILEERDNGKAFEVVKKQLESGLAGFQESEISSMVIAYEPVWAIGTGRTATPEQANEMCGYIRDVIEEMKDDVTSCNVTVLYGGSVKPANATEIMGMEEIDGALVGGASLVPADFIEIVNF